MAIVLVLQSDYLDRMIAIFADVILMLMAAVAGFIGGYWILMRLAGETSAFELDLLQHALLAPVIVFAVSLITPGRIRSSVFLRVLAILVLLVTAPYLLIFGI